MATLTTQVFHFSHHVSSSTDPSTFTFVQRRFFRFFGDWYTGGWSVVEITGQVEIILESGLAEGEEEIGRVSATG